MTLSGHHRHMLHVESAIDDDIIKKRGYFTITTSAEAHNLGFNWPQARQVDAAHPALIIPYYKSDGTNSLHCMRPDNPRVIDDKKKKKLPDGTYPQKVFKYEMPKGVGNVLDSHPAIIPSLGDPKVPLFFTEGAKKADSLISHGYLAINLNGVWGWRGTGSQTQGKTALPDFEDIALNGRTCYLLFDSDVRTNDHVKQALRRFRSYLMSKDAEVIPIRLPPTTNGKTGIDDYFAAGNTAVDLDALITYWTAFAPDLRGGALKTQWTTDDIKLWYADQSLTFAINDMSEALMMSGQRFTDTHDAIIRTKLRDDSLPLAHAEDTRILLGNENRYHPIKQYFRSLPWDGQSDHIATLASYFDDTRNVFYDWLKRWLIGAVAKVEGGGSNQNFMLVLDGGQGIGKSEFVRWLCPIQEYFLESPVNPEEKDCQLRLIQNFIWEVGELGHIIRRADREAFKRFLTTQRVQVRPPYGRHDMVKPATASFIGTVNNEGGGFLNDPTGSRRFAVTTVTSIDWAYSNDIDVNDVWAQAYGLYQAGEMWEFRGNEAARRDEINAAYQEDEPLDDMVLTRFDIDPTNSDLPTWRMTSPQILAILGLKVEDRGLTMRLASVMKRLELEKTKPLWLAGTTKRQRYYCGIRPKS